jgi:hypothetical protein
MEKRKILGIGHPRTGTGYTANFIKKFGIDVGHEVMFKDGIVAWQLATDFDEGELPFMHRARNIYFKTYNWESKIYNVRNPIDSIVSVSFTELKTLDFRSQVAGFEKEKNRVTMAIKSILHWDKMILDKKPDIIYRIEYDTEKLFQFLNERYSVKWNKMAEMAVNDIKNKRKHPDISELKDEFDSVPDELRIGINNYCKKYDYPLIY